jgi:starvation-inducible DNA-binding protein
MATVQETKRPVVKSFSAAPQLATMTDLAPQEAKAIAEAVNPLIADAFALYVKTKNYHWHLFGPHFRDYHLLFDEQAASIFESIDTMAERVRKIGATTIRSISQISQLQTIRDDDSNIVSADDMVSLLLEDNAHMAKMIRNAISICDKNRDSATSNLLQEILDQTERRVWFLFEVTQGTKRTS